MPSDPPKPFFEVYKYSIDRLKALLSEKTLATQECIADKGHVSYFEEYFGHIKPATIVVENDYVDRDYLNDYAGYYVRCFHPYKRRCVRLHFFKCEFEEQDFDDLLRAQPSSLTAEKLQQDYLGFIVLKPLPVTVIGRTCLVTYDEDNGRRHYPIKRKHSATLFGIGLEVKNTLAFQEQDSVVAACATSALWSAFQGTGMLFHHRIPSPIEITRAVEERVPSESRSLPNSGLSMLQMAQAVRSVGLEPLVFRVENHLDLRNALYAYTKGGIPVLLSVRLYDMTDLKERVARRVGDHAMTDLKERVARRVGDHAVAVTGFSLGAAQAVPLEPGNTLLKATRIDKLYVHDDQVGPFARMEFGGPLVPVMQTVLNDSSRREEKVVCAPSLSTSWRNACGKDGYIRAVPRAALIPLHHKIRIPVKDALTATSLFDGFVEPIRESPYHQTGLGQRLVWDVFLTTTNALKEDVRKMGHLSGDYQYELLTEHWPRYIWRASASSGDEPVLELLFDATDIEQGRIFLRAIEHNESFCRLIGVVSENAHLERPPGTAPLLPILKWFAENARPRR